MKKKLFRERYSVELENNNNDFVVNVEGFEDATEEQIKSIVNNELEDNNIPVKIKTVKRGRKKSVKSDK